MTESITVVPSFLVQWVNIVIREPIEIKQSLTSTYVCGTRKACTALLLASQNEINKVTKRFNGRADNM